MKRCEFCTHPLPKRRKRFCDLRCRANYLRRDELLAAAVQARREKMLERLLVARGQVLACASTPVRNPPVA